LMGCALLAVTTLWVACENEGNENEGGANHNVGMDCLACHKIGGGGKGVFTAGGTVFQAGTSTGAAGVSIKLYTAADHSGTPVASFTSEVSGNFHSQSTIDFGTGLYVTITSATGSSSMMTPVTSGACNSCHGAGTTGKISVQ
jgi:hypothetical protein